MLGSVAGRARMRLGQAPVVLGTTTDLARDDQKEVEQTVLQPPLPRRGQPLRVSWAAWRWHSFRPTCVNLSSGGGTFSRCRFQRDVLHRLPGAALQNGACNAPRSLTEKSQVLLLP